MKHRITALALSVLLVGSGGASCTPVKCTPGTVRVDNAGRYYKCDESGRSESRLPKSYDPHKA